MKPFALILLALAAAPVQAQTLNSGASLTNSLRPLAQEFCVACHNSEKTEGELDLEALLTRPDKLWADSKLLQTLYDVITEQEMPPKKAKKKLQKEQRAQLAGIFENAVSILAAAQQDDPGLVLIPRLTRSEYRNVLRDLSKGVLRSAGEYLPNEGGAGEGFANVGEAQSMSPAVLEKYLEAAKGALRHLRGTSVDGLVWSAAPRDPVDEPAAARQEAIDNLIGWHTTQQQKWGRDHRDALLKQLGFNDAAYFEAAWRFRWRAELGNPNATFTDIARNYDVPLAPVVLEKWFTILSADKPVEMFVPWAKGWQALDARAKNVRAHCIEIISGKASVAKQTGPAAPPYEISFQEAITEVTGAATERGVWPFRIAIGEAKEFFLVVTDADDGNQGEFATWRGGRFQMSDGTVRPWHEVSKITGANSGKEFPFGRHGKDGRTLPVDQIGVQPPGILRATVPPGAVTFELELALDPESFGKASVQALVLKEKPKSQNYIPGRMVFGGKPSEAPVAKQDAISKELLQALRKRNVAEANLTKIGLSAERNVLASWTRSSLELLGGPWPTHVADAEDPRAPYHLTVEQVRRNATPEDLAELHTLEDRLVFLLQAPEQELVAFLKANGIDDAREGVLPEATLGNSWSVEKRTTFAKLRERISEIERNLESKVATLLGNFASQAWRRSLTEVEQSLLFRLYREARAQGASFDTALKSPLLVVLASPHFIYHHWSGDGSALAGAKTLPLSTQALASRLSFFLWASIPDQELLHADLRNPDVMSGQVRRILGDPRAQSLATDFAAQLWNFSDFEHYTGPDATRFKEFTPALRQAMLDEVTRFITDLITHDRPLRNLLDADYTFANGALAKHYGLKSVTGDNLQRISLEGQRGGLAGMALFLTKTSLPLRTSPVQRGVWLMEKILGRQLKNPPPDVPKLSEDEKTASGLNIREQLEKHRADALCSSCHDKIDPLGIALENFDPIGRARLTERDGAPLATIATTHDGSELNGLVGLKRYLLSRQEEFFRHFNRKLLGYALGRAVLPGDRALLERMNSSCTTTDSRFSVLVEFIVNSPQFTTQRAAQPLAVP